MPRSRDVGAAALLLGGLPLVVPAGPADPPPLPEDTAEALLEFLGEAGEAAASFDEFFDSLPDGPEGAPSPPVLEEDEDQ